MSSIDQRPVNALQLFDANGRPCTQAGNAPDAGATAASHSPFDTLLAGLHQMILLGQAARPHSVGATARDGGDGQ